MGLFGALLDVVLRPPASDRRLRAVADDPASAKADDIARLLNRNPHVSQPCAFKGRLLAHVVQVRQRI